MSSHTTRNRYDTDKQDDNLYTTDGRTFQVDSSIGALVGRQDRSFCTNNIPTWFCFVSKFLGRNALYAPTTSRITQEWLFNLFFLRWNRTGTNSTILERAMQSQARTLTFDFFEWGVLGRWRENMLRKSYDSPMRTPYYPTSLRMAPFRRKLPS